MSDEVLDDNLAKLRAENLRLRKTFDEDKKRLDMVREEVVRKQLYLDQLKARRVLLKEFLSDQQRKGGV